MPVQLRDEALENIAKELGFSKIQVIATATELAAAQKRITELEGQLKPEGKADAPNGKARRGRPPRPNGRRDDAASPLSARDGETPPST